MQSYFFTLYRTVKKGLDIDIWGFYQPLVDDPLDARVSGAASFRIDIVSGLYFLVNYVIKYDDSPPAGVQKRDYQLRSGLGWTF